MKSGTTFSIIIPVLNEADRVNGVLGHLHELDHDGPVEIIIVDGDPHGGTISTIRNQKVTTALSGKGRARQMNRGASLADGDVLIFLHADTQLPQKALLRVAEAMNDKRCVAGAFDLGLDTPRTVFRITEKYVALRTRLTRIPFGDQAIFIRRDYFNAVGGYKDMPIMEDIELMSRIRKRGDLICVISDKVTTSVRRWEQEGILYCTFRNWALQLSYLMGVRPERLARWYNLPRGRSATPRKHPATP